MIMLWGTWVCEIQLTCREDVVHGPGMLWGDCVRIDISSRFVHDELWIYNCLNVLRGRQPLLILESMPLICCIFWVPREIFITNNFFAWLERCPNTIPCKLRAASKYSFPYLIFLVLIACLETKEVLIGEIGMDWLVILKSNWGLKIEDN